MTTKGNENPIMILRPQWFRTATVRESPMALRATKGDEKLDHGPVSATVPRRDREGAFSNKGVAAQSGLFAGQDITNFVPTPSDIAIDTILVLGRNRMWRYYVFKILPALPRIAPPADELARFDCPRHLQLIHESRPASSFT